MSTHAQARETDMHPHESTSRRRLPIRIANEARMIHATIDLVGRYDVHEVTSRMIADASGTATNYITRYFGSRDGLMWAAADELGVRLGELIDSGMPLLRLDQSGTRLTRMTSRPEVTLWFKLYRYLTGRTMPPARPREGRSPLVVAVERAISRETGLEGRYLPICANVFLTYTMGNEAFGDLLGTTPDEAEEVLVAMYEMVGLLMAQGDAA